VALDGRAFEGGDIDDLMAAGFGGLLLLALGLGGVLW